MTEWIITEYMKPEEGVPVLVTLPGIHQFLCSRVYYRLKKKEPEHLRTTDVAIWWGEMEKWTDLGGNRVEVIAWTPLPEPYKV